MIQERAIRTCLPTPLSIAHPLRGEGVPDASYFTCRYGSKRGLVGSEARPNSEGRISEHALGYS